MVTPTEFLISNVKPVSKVEMIGYNVTLIVIFRLLFFDVSVGPPEPSAQIIVSSFHDEPV